MLKKLISAALAAAAVFVLSVSALADGVVVGGESTTILAGEKLSTGTGEYKTVLVTSANAILANLTSDDIYYIDQAENEVQAFTNMGLKGGAAIEPGNYTMYLVGAEDTQPKSQTIIVSNGPFEGEGQSFDAITEGGESDVYEKDGQSYINKGYKVKFTPDSGRTVSEYKIYISYEKEGKTYTYPKVLNGYSGAGSLDLGLQINGIPCDNEDKPSVEFTAKLVPIYFN